MVKKKNKKDFLYLVIAIVVLLVVIGLFVSFITKSSKIEKVTNTPDLSQYRSNDIPEDCRLPKYENNIKSWKEHLSHHQPTLYCLDYFK